MNFIDMKTVLLTMFATDIVCTLVLIQLWRQSRERFAGSAHWVVGYTLHTAGLALIILRGNVPDWITYVLSNTMIIGGVLLVFMGLERFVGKRGTQLHNYLLLLAFSLLQTHFSFVQPDLRLKTVFLSAALLITAFQCSWLMLARVTPHARFLTRDVGIVFAAFGLVNLFRVFRALVTPDFGDDLFHQSATETIFLILYQLMLVLMTYSLSLMVNRRLMADIKSEEEKFSKGFQCSPYAIMLTRSSDGTIFEVNEGFVSTTGYSHAEVLGKTTMDLNIWRNNGNRDAIIGELLRTGSVRGIEEQFRNKAGETRIGLLSAELITINDEKSILSSIVDITDRKKAVDERIKLEQRLQQAQKAESLNRMAGAIAHNFNNILTVVIGNLELALCGLPHRSEVQSTITEAMKASKRAADVSRFMLTYLGQTIVKPRSIDLATATEQACSLLIPSIPKGVRVKIALPAEGLVIRVDADHVAQILSNLITNAIEAIGTRDGGIEISVDMADAGETRESTLFPPEWEPKAKSYACLTVADSGEGMDEKTLQNVFDPFFSTRFTGRGLGLSVVMGLIRTYDGAVSVKSHPGKGAIFRVLFPLAPSADSAGDAK